MKIYLQDKVERRQKRKERKERRERKPYAKQLFFPTSPISLLSSSSNQSSIPVKIERHPTPFSNLPPLRPRPFSTTFHYTQNEDGTDRNVPEPSNAGWMDLYFQQYSEMDGTVGNPIVIEDD